MTRSDAIDQIVSSFLKRPVEVSWAGGLAEPLQGSFSEAEVAFTGVATAWLPLERVALRARKARITPGVPALLDVEGPEIEVTIGQADVDAWLARFDLPFKLQLAPEGLRVRSEVAGFPISDFETRLDVVRGWFVLRPTRAAFLGMPQYVSSFFRTYLPVPPLSETTRLASVDHAPGEFLLRFALDDFSEEITPGLLDRLTARVRP